MYEQMRLHDGSWREMSFNLMLAMLAGCGFGLSVFVSPLIVPAAVVLIALAFYLIPRPVVTCYVLIGVITFTSAMPRGKLIPMLAPNELMLLAAVAIVALQVLIAKREKPLAGAVLFAGIVLIAVTVVVPIIAFSIMGHSFAFITIFKMAAPIQYLLLFWVFANAPQTDGERHRIIQVMFLCASGVSLIALLQAANVRPVILFLSNWYATDHTLAATGGSLGRLTSVFGAWNVLGTFLMMNLLLLLSVSNQSFPRWYKINMRVSAILSLFALLGSGSYASIIGLAIGVVIVKSFDPRGLKKLVPMFLVAGIALLILSPIIAQRFAYQFERSQSGFIPQTLEFRFQVWQDIYLPLIMEHPIWGVAPTLTGLDWAHAESQYLLLMFRSGLVSLIGFFIWLATLLFWLFTIIIGKQNLMRSLAISMFALLLVLAVMGLTNPVFTYSGVIDFLWIILGLITSQQKVKLHVTF